ncbi:Aspartate carbamoyltransferase [Abeliophyllum distichum]|uniref:Aspartate carbamoyltransferase n=1 Tax=Abeliophyllum distichum TaxID=126358 RepID=A0ABD1UFE4_9LAMI
MASSTTFSSWTFNGSMHSPKTTKHCSKFICNCLNWCFKQTIYSISSCASHDMMSPNGKGDDWERGRLSLKSRGQCRALEIGIKSSYSVGNKFQLEDVIEAQQFERDTLGAIF